MKAGGAPLALNPNERLNYFINLTKAQIVVLGQEHADLLSDTNVTLVTVNAALMSELHHVEQPLDLVSPDDTAFVIFTSGST